MPISPIASEGVSFHSLNTSVYDAIRTHESRLRSTVERIGEKEEGDITQGELLKAQQESQMWTLLIDFQSTMNKLMADSLKSIIQKSG